MKIVQINAVYGFGSTGRICQDIHRVLPDCGENSWVFASSIAPGVADKGVSLVGTKLDHKAHAVLSRATGWQAHYSRSATKKLMRAMGKIDPDVVVLHNLHANFVSFPMLMRFLAERYIPTLLYLHDCWFYTGKCTHYTQCGCYKWQSACGDCPKLKDDIPSWHFDRTPQMLEEKRGLYDRSGRIGVIGVSDWVLNSSRQGILGLSRGFKRIYNWVDLSVFRPMQDARPRIAELKDIEGQIILCVSSGWARGSRRVENLQAIASQLHGDETLVVVGAIEKDLLPTGSVYLSSINDKKKMAQVYSAADVYLHLGEEDTFGNVIAEALACGTPVVAFDSTSYPELVGRGCGRCVKAGDIDAMRAALDEVLYRNRADANACRASAESRFDRAKLMPELIDYLRSVSQWR